MKKSRPSTHFLNQDTRRWFGETNRSWRKKKRAELRKLEEAAQEYLCGSAFTPFSALQRPKEPMSLLGLIKHMRDQLSVKNWGQ